MSAVSAWIMCILGVVILGVILDLLLSGSRMHKLIQTVFATVIILIIITPVPSLIKSGFGLKGTTIFDTKIELDSSYLDYANRTKSAALELGVVDALASEGFKNVEVKIEAEFGSSISIRSVSVNLSKLVIDQNYLHINKYEYVLGKVSGYLDIPKERIIVYG